MLGNRLLTEAPQLWLVRTCREDEPRACPEHVEGSWRADGKPALYTPFCQPVGCIEGAPDWLAKNGGKPCTTESSRPVS
jgi:hypothetical protein